MNRHIGLYAAVVVAVGVFALTGCAEDKSTLEGEIRDSQGTQPQSKLGGAATVSSTTAVRVSSVGSGGSLTTVAEANVQASGAYSISVPAATRRLIIEGRDAAGAVTASAIVETTGTASQTLTVTPMDTESSVEAQVFIAMAAKGRAVADINPVDLRARINTNVAVAVAASTDSQARINALAEGIIAAQETQLKIYSHAGVNLTQNQLFEAEIAAVTTLNVALDASSSSAYSDFTTSYDSAIGSLNVTAKARAQAESAAAASFRATVEARLGGPDAVTDAALRAAAVLEAHVTTVSVNAILSAGAASNTSTTAASAAATTLQTSLANASTSAQASAAFATYVSAMTQTSAASPLGSFVGVTGGTQAALDGAVTSSTSASAALEAGLDTAFLSNGDVGRPTDYFCPNRSHRVPAHGCLAGIC